MRIIVWGINYAPELTGIGPFNTGLCEYLAERGHQVEMVTTFPYYPFWKKIPGDHGRIYRTDQIDDVHVHRCWHYVPAKATTVRRIWHELSFVLTSFLRVLFLARPDLYIVVSPPLLLGPFAAIAAWLKRRRYVFHVQDLQPDAALGLGMVQPGAFTRLLFQIESTSYRHAATVSGISHGMIDAFDRKGVTEEKRLLFPNWIRWSALNAEYQPPGSNRDVESRAFREKFGVPARAFLASYSGNLGRKQDLETLVSAAAILRVNLDKRVTPLEFMVLIVGDGVMRQALQEQILALDIKHRVRMLPLLIDRDYHHMLVASDVCLITQAPGTGQYFFPSKLLSVLSVGTPVLSVADESSELARAVREGGFGANVLPGTPQALAKKLSALIEDPSPLEQMRANTAWVRQFSASRVLPAFEQKLRAVIRM